MFIVISIVARLTAGRAGGAVAEPDACCGSRQSLGQGVEVVNAILRNQAGGHWNCKLWIISAETLVTCR
jgi:hypothetical protein